ncbi:putative stress response protein ish1 [Kalaharituber pfeilii]|nr:putative stress response protein ish1 [Kalaharituber pfeilii]
MKLTPQFLVLALYASSAVAILGFGKSAYNKWHETELERWLADHDIPYPTPADRKDLENLVKENWDKKVSSPYTEWDAETLQAYLKQKGVEINEKSKDNKNWLVETVKKNWYEAENTAEDAYNNVKNWIFDTWTDSQLKAFLDRHGIPNPTPRKRETLLETARENYQVVADKIGETAAYPGNWLYEAWSESDLKKWLDERGIPVPQPTTRDKLIAQVRRNSRLASLKLKEAQASASASAQAVKESISNAIFESWSDSELKKWADENGIKVPQGSTRNELLALARRNRAYLSDDTISASMSAAYKSATNTAASVYSRATDTTYDYGQAVFDKAIEAWSDSRLKAYLDSRGVPVPQHTKRDELLAKVRLHRHKAATGYGAWTFDTWTYDNLKKYLEQQGTKASSAASSSASTSREDLVRQAQEAYAAASASGGSAYASVTSALAKATDSVKSTTFDTWSDSELKAYLDSYGIKTYQGSTRNELLANARRAQHLFLYGSAGPTQTMYQKVKWCLGWMYNQFAFRVGLAQRKVEEMGDKARESAQYNYDRAAEESREAVRRAEENAKYGYDRVYEEGKKGAHKVKQEL